MPVSDQAFSALREEVVTLKVARATSDETQRNIDRRLSNIERMNAGILMLILSVIVGSVWAFISHGGLNVLH